MISVVKWWMPMGHFQRSDDNFFGETTMRVSIVVAIILVGQAGSVLAYDFDWKNLLMASLKLRQSLDYDANVDSYMQVFRPDVWNRYRNDEFEMAEKRRETIEIMKKAVAAYSLDEDIVVTTSMEIGSYDFETKGFPLDGLNESSYYYASSYQNGNFPNRFTMHLSNPAALGHLQLSEAQAKEFLNSRKNRNGEISRKVYVKLYLRVKKFRNEPDALLGEITKYSIYADAAHLRRLSEVDVAQKAKEKKAAETAALTAQTSQ